MFWEGVVIYSLFSDVFNDGRIGEEARRRRRRNRYLNEIAATHITCTTLFADSTKRKTCNVYIRSHENIIRSQRQKKLRWESMYYYTRRFVESANRVVHVI